MSGFWPKCKELDKDLCQRGLKFYGPANVPKRGWDEEAEILPPLILGFRLGTDKVARVLEFYTKLLNPGHLICSTKVWSNISDYKSIPIGVINSLETMELKESRTTSGARSFKATGKKKLANGEWQTDDLAVAIIMSSVLQMAIIEHGPKNIGTILPLD